MGIHNRYPLMADAGAGAGGAGGAPETMEVDLFDGVKITMPKADALRAIAARDANKSAHRTVTEELGKIKGEKDAAETARKRAEDERAAIAALQAGEIEKARALMSKETKARETKISEQLRDERLRNAVLAAQGLVKHADESKQRVLIDDMVAQLRSSCQYDLDAANIVVIGADGRPAAGQTVDAVIAAHIAARPHLQSSATSSGSGAGGGGGKGAGGPVITQAQFETMTPAARAKHFAAGGTMSG